MKIFDPEFCEWMTQSRHGTKFGVRDGRPYMTFNNGEEFFFFDTLPDGWIRLTHTIRSDTPHWELDAATMEVAEVYLSVQYGNAIRVSLGLERLDRRERVGEESPAMTRTVVDWIGPPVPGLPPLRMEVFSSNQTPVARFGYPLGEYTPQLGEWSREAGATWYIDKPLSEVLSALRHPTGSPLFELLGDRRA